MKITLLIILIFIVGCVEKKDREKLSFFVPSQCIDSVKSYLDESYIYLQEAEVDYKFKDVESLPLHLYGSIIADISWLKNRNIDTSVIANLNSIFSECDANDGVLTFENKEINLEKIKSIVSEVGGSSANFVIHINNNEVSAYYSKAHNKALNSPSTGTAKNAAR